jgi:hypothetical protein
MIDFFTILVNQICSLFLTHQIQDSIITPTEMSTSLTTAYLGKFKTINEQDLLGIERFLPDFHTASKNYNL